MSTSGDSDVRALHDKLLDLGQCASASIAPASYKAFQGYQLRGAFMVGWVPPPWSRTVVMVLVGHRMHNLSLLLEAKPIFWGSLYIIYSLLLLQAENMGPIGAKRVSSALNLDACLSL